MNCSGPLYASVTHNALEPLSAVPTDAVFFTHGMNVTEWLLGAAQRPSLPYMASIPISFPLTGLTELVQYLAVCCVPRLAPKEPHDCIAGITGRSQGIISVAIAASPTLESFIDDACEAIEWLLCSDCRVALEPRIVRDTVDGGGGVPSSVLSITGLSLEELATYINNANSHIPDDSFRYVTSPRLEACVVTGPDGLVSRLVGGKMRADLLLL
jgi:fatty acid synthase subunit alpha